MQGQGLLQAFAETSRRGLIASFQGLQRPVNAAFASGYVGRSYTRWSRFCQAACSPFGQCFHYNLPFMPLTSLDQSRGFPGRSHRHPQTFAAVNDNQEPWE